MNRARIVLLRAFCALAAVAALSALFFETPISAGGRSAAWALERVPAERTVGIPSRAPDLDALPGFSGRPGYGEVAFYWWLAIR